MKNRDIRKKLNILTEGLSDKERTDCADRSRDRNADLIERYYRPAPQKPRYANPRLGVRRFVAAALCACVALLLCLAVFLPLTLRKDESVYLNFDNFLSDLTPEQLVARSGGLMAFRAVVGDYGLQSSTLFYADSEEDTVYFFVDYVTDADENTLRVFFVEDMRFFEQIPGYTIYDDGFDGYMTFAGAVFETKSVNTVFVAKTKVSGRLIAFMFNGGEVSDFTSVITDFLCSGGEIE